MRKNPPTFLPTDEERLNSYGFSPEEIETFLNDHASTKQYCIVDSTKRYDLVAIGNRNWPKLWIYDTQFDRYFPVHIADQYAQKLLQTTEEGKYEPRDWYAEPENFSLESTNKYAHNKQYYVSKKKVVR